MTLTEFFSQYPKAALALSGGVDSIYLLFAARSLGADIKPYFMQTAFQPKFELEDAKTAAPDVTVLPLDILQIPDVRKNPEKRCYYCKNAMFSAFKAQALADGYEVFLDGTNASDDSNDRPGMAALAELGVLSPLRLCGLKKEDVRALAKQAGLPVWNKPSYACLATRLPTGMAIERNTLGRVEAAEQALHDLGYEDLRVRVTKEGALLQLPASQLSHGTNHFAAIQTALKPYFDRVMLDPVGRPG